MTPSDSQGPSETIYSESFDLQNQATLGLVASGVTDASRFEHGSSNSALRPMDIALPGSDEGPSAGNVGVNIFHAATDAPAVDIVTGGGSELAQNLTFGQKTGILKVGA